MGVYAHELKELYRCLMGETHASSLGEDGLLCCIMLAGKAVQALAATFMGSGLVAVGTLSGSLLSQSAILAMYIVPIVLILPSYQGSTVCAFYVTSSVFHLGITSLLVSF